MADYKRTKFERRMKAHRDYIKKKQQESIVEETEEKKTMSEEDKQRFLEMIKRFQK